MTNEADHDKQLPMDMSPKAIAYRARKARNQRDRRKRIPDVVRAYDRERYASDPQIRRDVEKRRWMRSDKVAARVEAKRYVKEIRSRTVCERCGEQPIEWHHDDHPNKPHDRVSSLAAQGKPISRIDAEIARCTPLCRRCHQELDGRLENLRRGTWLRKSSDRNSRVSPRIS